MRDTVATKLFERECTPGPISFFSLFSLSPRGFGGSATPMQATHNTGAQGLGPPSLTAAQPVGSAHQTLLGGILGLEQAGDWLEAGHLRSSSILARRAPFQLRGCLHWVPPGPASMLPPPAGSLLPTRLAPMAFRQTPFCPSWPGSIPGLRSQHT